MPANSPWSTLILIVLMIGAFYLLIIRPQKKRQQAQQQTMNAIQPGTKVLLGSGIFGVVTSIGEKQAVLQLAPGVELTVLKQAIARVVTDGDEFDDPTLSSVSSVAGDTTDPSADATTPGADSSDTDSDTDEEFNKITGPYAGTGFTGKNTESTPESSEPTGLRSDSGVDPYSQPFDPTGTDGAPAQGDDEPTENAPDRTKE